ncbi:hypothetical protein N7456_013430 [Penicillium angulare]|uniref:Uncharacterized protein n=1 Tax=Penicillium angulare TaxID=116970 RepID=A0A9W9EG36_9EURO|nr:hypothetical protein N7456_013430 [Penicillium angulare]
MKFFTLHLVLLLGTFLGPVAAYDKRGTTENMSYYYMYLLESLDGKTSSDRIVAPGCAAAMLGEEHKDKECDLKQFLKYIWYPRIGTGQFPKDASDPSSEMVSKTVYGMGDKSILDANGQPASLEVALTWRDKLDKDADQLDRFQKQQINWENKAALPKLYGTLYNAGYTDGADSKRLVRGATTFAEARTKVTQFLPNIAARYPMLEKKELSRKKPEYRLRAKMVEAAQNCVEAAYQVRLWDYESYRISQNGLKQRLDTAHPSLNSKIKTKKIDTMIITGKTFQALDADATLAANPDMTSDELVTACVAQRTRGGTDHGHWQALEAAEASVSVGQCVRVDVQL